MKDGRKTVSGHGKKKKESIKGVKKKKGGINRGNICSK